MMKKKRTPSIGNLNLTNPQKTAVTRILSAQKNKYKKLLHEAHERMHIIADMTSSLEFWYNVNGNYEFVSRSSESVLGYTPEAFTRGDLRLEQLVHDDYIEQFSQDRAAALEGVSGESMEYRIRTREGDARWVEAHWYPVLTRKGKHIGIRISLRDITEFKQCQYLSRAYEQLSLTIADELVEVGIFSLTTEGRFKSWNSGAIRLLGWEKDDIIDQPIGAILREEEELRLMQRSEAARCGDKTTTVVPFRHKEGGGERAMKVILINLCNHQQDLHQVTFLIRAAD